MKGLPELHAAHEERLSDQIKLAEKEKRLRVYEARLQNELYKTLNERNQQSELEVGLNRRTVELRKKHKNLNAALEATTRTNKNLVAEFDMLIAKDESIKMKLSERTFSF